MAKVYYDQTSPFGSKVYVAIQQIKAAQAAWGRIRAVMDEISNNAANPALLEGSKEFGVAAGGGTNFYNAVTGVQAALFAGGNLANQVQATIDLDQG